MNFSWIIMEWFYVIFNFCVSRKSKSKTTVQIYNRTIIQIIFKNYSYLKPLTKLWLFVSIGNPRWLNLWEKYFKITQILNSFFLQIYRNRLNLNCTWIVIGLLFYFLCESKIQVNWHHRTLFNYGNMKKSISQKPQTCLNTNMHE